MKNIIPLLLLALLASCDNGSKKATAHVELVSNYIKNVENLDFDAMSSALDDDYIGLGPSFNDSINKVDAVKSWKYNIENLYEEIKYEKSRIVAFDIPDGENAGDWVSNWAQLHIKYKDSDDDIIIWANTAYQIKDNKIIRSYTFYNEADALEQLDYFFIHPDQLN